MAGPDRLILVDAHPPTLPAGTYEVAVRQVLDGHGAGHRVHDTFSSRARFHVLGPRFALEPAWIATRFPAPHSSGDHADVLPHVALSRSTLPWERRAEIGGDPTEPSPWLAVLLFTEAELAAGATLPAAAVHEVHVAELLATTAGRAGSPAFAGLDPEPGTDGAERVRVLDVPRGRLEPILPDGLGLHSFTHVRERAVGQISGARSAALDAGNLTPEVRADLRAHGCPLGPQAEVVTQIDGREWTVTDRESGRTWFLEANSAAGLIDVGAEAQAMVVSGRATVPGQRYQAFLVSVEGRYRRVGAATTDLAFDWGAATGPGDQVRLVVLDSWAFEVDSGAGRLEHALLGLAYDHPDPARPEGIRNFTLTVPTAGLSGPGVDALAAGYALLPHQLRNGGTTRTWYRGPLVPALGDPFPDPARYEPVVTSEQLLVVDNLYHLLDCSHAAAWELGRHLMLSNREVALDLVAWKRSVRRARHAGELQPGHHDWETMAAPAMPSSVAGMVERAALLDGIPFNYLVPDPAMLPMESIKTFMVDRWWVYHLLDGMLGLDRPHDGRLGDERQLWLEVEEAAYRHVGRDLLTGVLIRSDVVAAWPDLHIELSRADGSALPPVRRVNLSDNVVLVLVEGPLGRVVVRPNPEALHHGITANTPRRSSPVAGVVDVHTLVNPPGVPPLAARQVASALLASGPPVLEITFG